jgi:hypothetical protein
MLPLNMPTYPAVVAVVILAVFLCLFYLQDEAAAAGLGDPEQLDLRQEAKINSLELVQLFSERTALLGARAAMPAHTCPGRCAATHDSFAGVGIGSISCVFCGCDAAHESFAGVGDGRTTSLACSW